MGPLALAETSTRPDITGETLHAQLRVLQDRLPSIPTDEARRVVEGELGPRIWEMLGDLEEPVAAASIAQVHGAIWKPTGQRVAVKVLRPNVRRQFRADIGAFYFIAGLLEWIVPGARRLRPSAVVAHFEGVVNTELDLRLEADVTAQVKVVIAAEEVPEDENAEDEDPAEALAASGEPDLNAEEAAIEAAEDQQSADEATA